MNFSLEDEKKILEIASAIKDEFNPSRLLLFGSKAHGTARDDSDYDFVLVVPEKKTSGGENLAKARSLKSTITTAET